jgi:hypothetical protein
MVTYFIDLSENTAMKHVEVILNRVQRVRENDGGNESNQDTL